MAHPRAVAVRRQIAELKLRRVMEAAADKFGVEFKVPVTLPQRHPDLYAAELIESVSEAIEQITGADAPKQRRIA